MGVLLRCVFQVGFEVRTFFLEEVLSNQGLEFGLAIGHMFLLMGWLWWWVRIVFWGMDDVDFGRNNLICAGSHYGLPHALGVLYLGEVKIGLLDVGIQVVT
jgi:hypothetical protein